MAKYVIIKKLDEDKFFSATGLAGRVSEAESLFHLMSTLFCSMVEAENQNNLTLEDEDVLALIKIFDDAQQLFADLNREVFSGNTLTDRVNAAPHLKSHLGESLDELYLYLKQSTERVAELIENN